MNKCVKQKLKSWFKNCKTLKIRRKRISLLSLQKSQISLSMLVVRVFAERSVDFEGSVSFSHGLCQHCIRLWPRMRTSASYAHSKFSRYTGNGAAHIQMLLSWSIISLRYNSWIIFSNTFKVYMIAQDKNLFFFFSSKKCRYFSYFYIKTYVVVLIRNASARRF